MFYGIRTDFIDINEFDVKGNVDEFSFYILYKIQKQNDSNITQEVLTEEEFSLNLYYDNKIFDHENTNAPVRNSTYNLAQNFSTSVLVSIDAYWLWGRKTNIFKNLWLYG